MRSLILLIPAVLMLLGCGSFKGRGAGGETGGETENAESAAEVPAFNSDSAYAYVARQVEFGPRVPNSPAHEAAAAWLASELGRHGATVTLQKADLRAWDGTVLRATNIMGSFNPEAGDRLLLLAHYDTRPWADKDPDPANRKTPIDGANDGASGVGVLLETARVLGAHNPRKGIDILFVDAEDYGTDGDDDSWALGARYFATHPIREGYAPSRAILLDMTGDKDAVFPAEYFSREAAPALDDSFRAAAARAGYAGRFPAVIGGGITDDHLQLIEQGIPAIDIIDYRTTGFCPSWHTLGDTMERIDPATLQAVGASLLQYIYD